MQLMGLVFGLAIAMPVAGDASPSSSADATIEIDITTDEPIVRINHTARVAE